MAVILLTFDSLLKDFQNTFYTEPVMIFLNIAFLFVGFRSRPTERKYQVLIGYGLVALFQDIIGVYASLTEHTNVSLRIGDREVLISIIFFTILEYFAFFTFFYHEFEGKPFQQNVRRIRNLITILSTISICCILKHSNEQDLRAIVGYLSIFLSIILLAPTGRYFFTLFSEPPEKNLLSESSFWITTGMAFLHGLNIPLFLMESFVLKWHSSLWCSFYTINFAAYSCLFLMFIIGITCLKSNTYVQLKSRLQNFKNYTPYT